MGVRVVRIRTRAGTRVRVRVYGQRATEVITQALANAARVKFLSKARLTHISE